MARAGWYSERRLELASAGQILFHSRIGKEIKFTLKLLLTRSLGILLATGSFEFRNEIRKSLDEPGENTVNQALA